MDKKNRTGLQSKISHIFAGVPMPKKKRALSEQSESEKNNETPDLLLSTSQEAEMAKPALDNQIESPEQNENIIEMSLVEESPIEKPRDLQYNIEEKQNETEVFKSDAGTSAVQKEDVELPEEEFTIIQEQDFETEDQQKAEENKAQIDHKKDEAQDSKSGTMKSEEEISTGNLQTSHPSIPKTENMGIETDKPLIQKSTVEETVPDETPKSPPVKEPMFEKAKLLNQKSQVTKIQDTFKTQKHPESKTSKIETSKKKSLTVSMKKSTRQAGKRPKSKTSAAQPRQKLMVVLIVVFSIILVLVLLNNSNFFVSNNNYSEIIEQPVTALNASKNMGSIKIDWVRPDVYPDVIRDPMELGAAISVSNKNGFIVKGISESKGEFLVLIGEDNYKKNDKINGYDAIITNVTADKVEFQSSEGKVWSQTVGE